MPADQGDGGSGVVGGVPAIAERTRAARRLILPLAMAQFICSFAGSNMNVMITDISHDLNTDVKGVQTAITLFLLIMAILMIPCSKLTDRWGRKRCFIGGLTLYGIGALVSAVSPNLGVLILGNSVFEGVGTALLIPPVYILATVWFDDLTVTGVGVRRDQRAGRHRRRRRPADRRRHHDHDQLAGGIPVPGRRGRRPSSCSAASWSTRSRPTRRGRSTPSARCCRPSACSSSSSGSCRPARATRCSCCSWRSASPSWSPSTSTSGGGSGRARSRCYRPALFRNRTCNLALVTQNIQWLLLMGVSFVVSVFLQEVRGYSAIGTGRDLHRGDRRHPRRRRSPPSGWRSAARSGR